MAKSSPAWSSAFEAQEGQELTSRLAVRPPVSGLGSNATASRRLSRPVIARFVRETRHFLLHLKSQF
jgi:hypothetical protein